MKSIDELINNEDPGWPIVQEWISSAKNKIEILPVDKIKAKDALYKMQVTTRSPMGAIIYETGGLLVDNGWIRILGSGSVKLNRSLPDWNKDKGFKDSASTPSYLLIADDAIGGFFILNGGQLGSDVGNIYYLAPDTLAYEPLDLSYSEFINFCFNNDLDEFYKSLRWENWEKDVSVFDGDMVFNFYPFLWSKEGKDINACSRKIIPIEEQYFLNMNFRVQLKLE